MGSVFTAKLGECCAANNNEMLDMITENDARSRSNEDRLESLELRAGYHADRLENLELTGGFDATDFSANNIRSTMELIKDSPIADLNLKSEGVIELLKTLDVTGRYAQLGIFRDNPNIENIYSVLAQINIYNQKRTPGWSMDMFEVFLSNAQQYAGYYMPTRSIFEAVFKLQNPSFTENDINEYLNENSKRVFQAPSVIDQYFEEHDFDLTSLGEKTQAISGVSTDIVNFEDVFDAFNGNDALEGLEPYTKLKSSYLNFLMDNEKPQYPEYFFGLVNCLGLEDIKEWMSAGDEDQIRQAFKTGIIEKYQDEESEFSPCMIPFNSMAINWDDLIIKE